MSDIIKESESSSLTISMEDMDNKLNKILGSDNFPIEIREGLDMVLSDVNSNKNIVDLYPKLLSEIPFSSSSFQDQCVQIEEHHTSHRKLRQSLLEMQGKIDALDTAKNGYLKTMVKIKDTKLKMDDLFVILEEIKDSSWLEEGTALLVHTYFSDLMTDNILDLFSNENVLVARKQYTSILNRIKNEIENYLLNEKVVLDENTRSLTSSEHMVKDAALKVIHYKKLVSKYEEEVKKDNISFEQSEMIYYVMYFTTEIEKQLHTMHRIDTGTYGVIRFLPDGIRNKVLWNAEFIKKKIDEGWKATQDYISVVHRDILLPKIDGESVEGVNIDDFASIKPIFLIGKNDDSDNS